MRELRTGAADGGAARALPSFERIAVVGATGLVGREALTLLAERSVEPERVSALASERSGGGKAAYGGASIPVGVATERALRGVDLALLCADSSVARALTPGLLARGVTVIDNSAAHRMDPSVPLVVPSVNGEALDGRPLLVANPNCSTIILLSALDPLRRAFGVEAVDVATYQAASGAGARGVEELLRQARAFAAGADAAPEAFPEPCLFNVFCHESAVDPDTGLNGEEAKIIAESRRIWLDRALAVSPTCVRTPTLRAHAQAVRVRLTRPATEREVRERIALTPGLLVVDDRGRGRFPTPLRASGRDEVLVGRIRPDPATGCAGDERCKAFQMFVCADQLRVGAALNALRIAERLDALRGGG